MYLPIVAKKSFLILCSDFSKYRRDRRIRRDTKFYESRKVIGSSYLQHLSRCPKLWVSHHVSFKGKVGVQLSSVDRTVQWNSRMGC
jgi:hypothetical protein